ncbi:MAG TPA: DUF6597 domain-containing transcriptional factor [Kofleriaceae bacterium]
MRRASPPVELPYTEIASTADLAPYVDRLWLRTIACGTLGRVHRVLPDGCVDVIVRGGRGSAELVGIASLAGAVTPPAPRGRTVDPGAGSARWPGRIG